MIQTISTKNKNTAIFALLAFNANNNLLDAPIYLASFKILKTRNKRNALNATKPCEPAKIKERYIGIVDKKSTIPKKLKIYFVGLLIEMTLKIYYILNNIVIIHSPIYKAL